MHKMVAMSEAPHPRFLTIAQTAEELNVKVTQIRLLLKAGELRGLQVGGRGLWRIGRQDLEDYIAEAYWKTADRIAAGVIDEDVRDEIDEV